MASITRANGKRQVLPSRKIHFHSVRRQIEKLIVHLILIIFGIIFLLPFLWMISSSLKPSEEIFSLPVRLIPSEFKFSNYPEAIEVFSANYSFYRYLWNSIRYTILCTLGALIVNPFIAYGFARVRWPGRDTVFFIVLTTFMIPFLAVMVPLFVFYQKIGWLDTFKPLIVPYWFGDAYSIFLLRQFMMTIPKDLDDAARIDGCNELDIYWRIILPLVKPALVVILINYIVFTWGNFLMPLVFLRSQANYTLAIAMQFFLTLHGTKFNLLMVTATLMCIPIAILFFFAQRVFLQGITLTGVKG